MKPKLKDRRRFSVGFSIIFALDLRFQLFWLTVQKIQPKIFEIRYVLEALFGKKTESARKRANLAQYPFPDNVNTNIRRNMKTRRKKKQFVEKLWSNIFE